ncbi:MAG: hypothetical protein ACJZ46_04915 [Candidatus Thalassarchaeaceae archaeon]
MWSLADFGLDDETFDSILEKSVMKIKHEDDLGSPELENQFGHIELAVTITTPHYLKPPFDKLVIKNLPVPPISVRPVIRDNGKIVGDDLSLKLSHIIMFNRRLHKMIEHDKSNPDRMTPSIIIDDMTGHLEYLVRTYLDRKSSYRKGLENYLAAFLEQSELKGKSLDSVLDRVNNELE